MRARLPLVLLVVSCLAVAAAYAAAFLPGGAPPWAAWCIAIGSGGMLSSTMALGATRRGRLRPIALLACVLTFVVVSGAFGAALWMPPAEGANARLLFGLPLRTAIVLYGVGIVPLLFLPIVYAVSFDADTLNDEDLERVRRAAAERKP
ncbi:MAG: hypothetical protein H3C62_17480 [Gemmatimonadaceae bacterium]|nr:hypothetical protein [Gemmatimonadaceae bacterium]